MPARASGIALTVVLASVTWSANAVAQQPAPTANTKLTPAQIDAIYKARTDSARTHFTAADVHFMTGMIEHHGQALIMAGMAPTHGASPSVQTLCARIINAQKDEIATMQEWLRERGQPVPQVKIEGLAVALRFPADSAGMAGMNMGGATGKTGAGHDMHDMHMDGASMAMPGMLTAEQMAQLDRARGSDFDRLFLTGMIQHHRGAVTMVHDLFDTPGAGEDEMAFKLASDVQVDQTTEIARMEGMLAALPPAGASR